jgi:hypothetical protein
MDNAEMSPGKLAVSLLIPLWTAIAQSPLPALRVEATNGGSILIIRNVATQPLTGFLIELLNYPGSYYAFWQDDITSEPIAAGAEQKTQVNNMTIGAVPDYVKLEGALYADGSSSGALDKLALLIERRRFTLQTLRALIERVQKAQENSIGNDRLIVDLKQWSDSMQPGGKPKRYSQPDINNAAARSLIQSAVKSLGEHSASETLSELRAVEQRASGHK